MIRYLEFLDDKHSQRLDLIAEPEEIEPMLWAMGEHLCRRRDWDVLEMARLRAATAERVLRIWPQIGLPIRARGGARQRYLPLNGYWEEVSANFDGVLLKNLRRREKRLRQHGPLEVRLHTGHHHLRELLDQCFQVEASGWKGREGTAIRCRPPVERFYRQLAFRLAGRNQLRIYGLWQQDQLLAFQFCVTNGRRMGSLKVGYLDSHREYSPGQILQHSVLRMAWEEGHARYDFLGEDQPHQAAWAPLTETLVHLRVYNRTLRGRAMAQRSELWHWWKPRHDPKPLPEATVPADPV
jgi:CelD/BcsL family acetyltransferase involved in cellulose biosynthesis